MLQRLTGENQGNVQYRIALADALSNAARFYALIAAQNGKSATQDCTKAKSLVERSQQLWLELDKAGELPAARRRAIEDLDGELAKCNDSLAKLGPAQ